jgi:hypothetical protein
MIVPTSNLNVVMSSFSATELSPGCHGSKTTLPCQPFKPIGLLVPKAPVKQSSCFSSIEIYTAKMHRRLQSIATIRAHLVISQLRLQKLAQSILTIAITIVKISIPAG